MAIPANLHHAVGHDRWFLPMREIKGSEDAIDIWPYVDAIEPTTVGVRSFFDVLHVYQDASGRYDHVIIETDQENVSLVIVVNKLASKIFGHHLLDLSIEYGLTSRH